MGRSVFIGLFSALAFTQIAAAADIATKAPVSPAPVATYNWTGIYVGGSLGGAWATEGPYQFVDVIPNSFAQTSDANGWAGTGFLGAQWQWSSIVIGVEGNIYAMNQKHSGICPNTALLCQQRAPQSITIGPRLGWALNNWLVYGTGGWARTTIKSDVVTPSGGTVDQTDNNHNGWFAGVGVEYALLPLVIVGLEYTHIQANEGTDISTPLGGIDDRIVGTKINTVRGRVSIKFNPL